MKKLKISELPICSTLAGLFTIGVDNLNRSVKVSLQFVEDKVTEAVSKAMAATTSANSAAQAAQTAKTATETATADAQTATGKANEATAAANSAALSASQKAEAANTATEEAKAATAAANEATEAAQVATEETKTATAEAQAATADTLAKISILVPSALTVEAPLRITWGNVAPIAIKAVLSPVTAMRNLIYLSDNKAVEVSTDGVLTPVAKGVSRVHVIPTQNTALARTCLIEVGDPRLRISSQSALRFTQAGGLRLT